MPSGLARSIGGEMVLQEYKLIRRRAGDQQHLQHRDPAPGQRRREVKLGHVGLVICQTSTNRKDSRVMIY